VLGQLSAHVQGYTATRRAAVGSGVGGLSSCAVNRPSVHQPSRQPLTHPPSTSYPSTPSSPPPLRPSSRARGGAERDRGRRQYYLMETRRADGTAPACHPHSVVIITIIICAPSAITQLCRVQLLFAKTGSTKHTHTHAHTCLTALCPGLPG